MRRPTDAEIYERWKSFKKKSWYALARWAKLSEERCQTIVNGEAEKRALKKCKVLHPEWWKQDEPVEALLGVTLLPNIRPGDGVPAKTLAGSRIS